MGARKLEPATVHVGVLGPLELVIDGATVDVRGPKRRAVLALLSIAEGRAVTVERLVDALWPSEPPDSGQAALHSHVSRLRAHLGPAASRLETLDRGYRLALRHGELDAARARTLLSEAGAAAGDDPSSAAALLRQARQLWRGPALGDLTDVPPLAATAVAFERLHREVTDLLVACSIEAGQADSVVGLAAEALAEDPLREPAVLLSMRALVAAGQAPEALATGRAYRRRLADEAGLDPSPALAELERRIANGELRSPRPPTSGEAPRRRAGRVPQPLTRLIGREAQLASLYRLLGAERLVTLVGPGGVGKTRVALDAARRAETVTVLFLAPVTDPAAVPHALAAALDLREVRGDVLAASVAVLGGGPSLLVIDNCEHLLDAVRDTVVALLHGCPELTILATSREPLGLAAECPSRLAPLPLPSPEQYGGDADPLERVFSVALFLDRAARVRPGPPLDSGQLRQVADVVRRLDGMPLAIELAAGRLSTMLLPDLHDRLDRALDLLGGGQHSADARHRTLRATVEWSYGLLPEDERRLFRHLAVFVDGVDFATAEDVATDLGLGADPATPLAHLVDASMLDATFDGGRTRYRMLETLRAFGLDRLAAAGEADAAGRRLLRWAVEVTAWVDVTMTTECEPEADALLRREFANLRAAWRSARTLRLYEDAAAIVTNLYDAFGYRDLMEVRDWANELADDPALPDSPSAGAVLGTAAQGVYLRGDYLLTERLARAGLEVATTADAKWYCLMSLALADSSRGAFGDAIEHSLAAAELWDRPSSNLSIAALAAAYAGDLDQARTLCDSAVATATAPTWRALAAYTSGEIDNAAGEWDRADQHYTRALELSRASGATFLVGVASVGIVTARARAGRVHDALRGYRQVVDYWARTGYWTHQWTTPAQPRAPSCTGSATPTRPHSSTRLPTRHRRHPS